MTDSGESKNFAENLVERAKQSEQEEAQGAIREDGSINWECPCIQREVVGPCGVEFRTAFSAYVEMKKEGDTKPSENFMAAIKEFNSCSVKYPEYYFSGGKDEEDEDDDLNGDDDVDDAPDLDDKSSQDDNTATPKKS